MTLLARITLPLMMLLAENHANTLNINYNDATIARISLAIMTSAWYDACNEQR